MTDPVVPEAGPPAAERVLVGGVGYRHLRDHSVGVTLTDRLAERDWPAHVRVEDLSFNPVALAQRLEDELAEGPLRLILASAVARGRAPGTVTAYRWDRALPPADRVQGAVAEAVTGVIAIDNSLVVCRQFNGLPEHVIVVEIEPRDEAWGDELSPPVRAALPDALALLARLATDEAAAARVPEAPLGGGALPHVAAP